MRYAFTAAAILAAISTIAANCTEENGNWYCDSVQASTWSNFGIPGQYNQITSMTNGVCNSSAQEYAGGMSPMDGEVSWHFRGPLQLKQFAFYSPGSSPVKRDFKPALHQRRHLHQKFHRQDDISRKAKEERDVADIVTATINGQVVTWLNNYSGAATSTSSAVEDMVTATINGEVVSWVNNDAKSATSISTLVNSPTPVPTSPAVEDMVTATVNSEVVTWVNNEPTSATSISTFVSSPTPASISPIPVIEPANAGAGYWGRQAYYNSESGEADGLVFLNHNGGQGSGVFDYHWGNSLSYASTDGTTGSPSPVVLADTLIGDDNEIVVMTDNPCLGDSCGTYRPGTVAYHGFGGASKVFLIEYAMPLSGKQGFNADMPAAWILNAAIPRTMQYGPSDCSCWSSGCGEWDIFEVLDSGNTKSKSTWHGLNSMGDPNWFQRPIEQTQKAAVMFDGTTGTGHIMLLPSETTFDSTLADSVLAGFVNSVALSTQQNSKIALPP